MTLKALLSFAALMLAVRVAFAAEAAPESIGLAVGQRAPEFTLHDQAGKEVSLSDLRKKGPVAVVFVRSADWCLYCKMQLAQLQRNLKRIEATGGQVVSISFDSTEKIKRFAVMRKITFPMLSDVGSKTIDAYAMRDREAENGSANHGTFVVDRDGIIRGKPLILNYDDHAAMDALIAALESLQVQKETIPHGKTNHETPHP
jgi:peroxiredoxin